MTTTKLLKLMLKSMFVHLQGQRLQGLSHMVRRMSEVPDSGHEQFSRNNTLVLNYRKFARCRSENRY